MYDDMPRSPYSFGSVARDWKKVICWPRLPTPRLSYLLYMRHNHEEAFDKLRIRNGDEILPSEMKEPSIELYDPALEPRTSPHDSQLDGASGGGDLSR